MFLQSVHLISILSNTPDKNVMLFHFDCEYCNKVLSACCLICKRWHIVSEFPLISIVLRGLLLTYLDLRLKV